MLARLEGIVPVRLDMEANWRDFMRENRPKVEGRLPDMRLFPAKLKEVN